MQLVLDHVLTVAGFMLALVLAARVLREKRPPGSTVAWLMAIGLVPYIGVPLYLLVGGRKLSQFIKMKGQLYSSADSAVVDASAEVAAGRVVVSAGFPPPQLRGPAHQRRDGVRRHDAPVRRRPGIHRRIHLHPGP